MSGPTTDLPETKSASLPPTRSFISAPHPLDPPLASSSRISLSRSLQKENGDSREHVKQKKKLEIFSFRCIKALMEMHPVMFPWSKGDARRK
ncbi:unnamed protein product [Lactuca virosa]|uniref:Uncharacterized protein n=1 Tax=Lactuca virosa TaxID=75947 RepID=A0AAU9NP92_9ASTR|nr:unnamed protein product [Lactuca virosa]